MSQVEKNIQECPHLQISIDDKPSCINCGLVQERPAVPYIRSISHYKEIYRSNRNASHVVYLLPAPLQIQIHKFHIRTNRSKLSEPNNVRDEPSEAKMNEPNNVRMKKQYDDYIRFLNENAIHTLPKKERKRPISAIYGEHKRIILDWIMLCMD